MAELIVALDVASQREVEEAVERLDGAVDFYKIGLELFTAAGPSVVRAVKKRGKRVFLDLKLHDIPRTVERTVFSGADLGVDLMTVHASGGSAMIEAAADAARHCGAEAPKILAVTVLTSLDQADLTDLGVNRTPVQQVEALGRLALDNGADGIVCSPVEVARMRVLLGGQALLCTPGVRPAGSDAGDQKRIATPSAAVRDGSTYLVVGRPVMQAADPCAAARAIIAEMTSCAEA